MDNKDKSPHNHNNNGFLVGLILGSVVTLLFTTKKGREIIKDLTERGLEKFSDFQKDLKDAVEYEELSENDYIEPADRPEQPLEIEKPKLLAKEEGFTSTTPKTATASVRTQKVEKENVKNTQATKAPRSIKRFFRKKS